VRLRDDAGPLTLEELRAQLVDRLADYKLPRILVLTTEPLPRNAAGKLDKVSILAMTT
jgi:acyl-CoA synthetase (AMP-forming)/AMP-acid ligase II